MNRLSRYAAAALVASLMASAAAYASVPSTVPDMDIRLLCHEQPSHTWPCGDENVLAGCDFAYRTCGVENP